MKNRAIVFALVLYPAVLSAQASVAVQTDVRAILVARGMTSALAESVAVVAREASGRGLSSQPVVDKAVEGWFKHVPPPRILAAVRDLAGRMDQVRTELRGAGMAELDGSVIGAAAESRAQGIVRGDQVDIIRAAKSPAAASAGLSVSAALVVQGLDARTSARLVVESFRRGRSASQVLDLPAAARALQMRGTPTSARRGYTRISEGRLRITILGAAAALAAAAPLHAQLSLRVGVVRATYAGGAPVTGASIAPRLDWSVGRARGSAEFGFSQLATGSWAAQFSGDVATTRPLGDFAVGLAGSAVASFLEGSVWAGQTQAGLAVGHRVGQFTASVGGSLGALRAVSDTAHLLVAGRAALSTRIEGTDASVHAQRAGAGALRWTDLDVRASRVLGDITLEAGAGMRHFDSLGTDGAWHVQASTVVHRAFVVEAAVGAYPRSADGFTDGIFAALGVRIVAQPRASSLPTVERIDDTWTRVRLAVPGATTVDIAGDWNSGTPAPMTKDVDGRWSVELPLQGGAHKFVIVVNGTRQTVPRGVPTLPDGFGGAVGLLVVS